jgi:hypothetical protein
LVTSATIGNYASNLTQSVRTSGDLMMLGGSGNVPSKETIDKDHLPALQQSSFHNPKKRMDEVKKRFIDSTGEDPLTYLELTVKIDYTQIIND